MVWITNLFRDYTHVSLHKILLPGSHDTATYKFDFSIPLKGNKQLFNTVTNNKILGKILKPILTRWSQCHTLNFLEQLNIGIRFFDLRVGYLKNKIYFAHSFATMPMDELIQQIKQFYSQSDIHIKEPIILKFTYDYYNRHTMYSLDNKKKFWKKIMELYKYIYSIQNNKIPLLSDIHASGKPVILIVDTPLLKYRDEIVTELMNKEEFIYNDKCIIIPNVLTQNSYEGQWHNTFDIKEISDNVIKEINRIRTKDSFYNILGTITPQDTDVTNGIICLVLQGIGIFFAIITGIIFAFTYSNSLIPSIIMFVITIIICCIWYFQFSCKITPYSLKTNAKKVSNTVLQNIVKHDNDHRVSIITSDFTDTDFINKIIDINKKRIADTIA